MNISKSLIACAIAASLLTGAYAVAANSNNAATGMYGIGAPMAWPERKALITTIVTKWSAYVQKVEGTNATVWARSLGGTFATASPANMRRAATMTTYEGMIATLLGQKTTDAAVINTLAKSSTSATLAALASPASGLVYTMITPCRILDTRAVYGRLTANSTTSFIASNPGGDFTAQGGSDTDCGIPADPAAVVMNVVSVQPSGPGYITMFPYGVTQPLSSTINNVAGSDVANETVVKQTVGAPFDFSIYSYADTDVVADAVGYFAAPVSTALSTTIANGVNVSVADGATFTATAGCPTGYSVTGGGDVASPSSTGLTVSESYPITSGNTGWTVSGKNLSGGTLVVHARAVCASNN